MNPRALAGDVDQRPPPVRSGSDMMGTMSIIG